MIRHDLPEGEWRKSSYSGDTGATCIEIQATVDRCVAIGDSKARPRGAFVFSPPAWATFVHSIRTGEDTLQPTR
ncbi:DUF397 domain-containing protein [Streptomyces roseoverticillatus]|uniref:DUF397 domain-containing protein n=1 Tax=Streptomyces roseoverticillatus TaxID=66429 RepID=UPI001F1C2D55|nr:DUF397 domain-containing protein [Streptomyces roseoverticillatus]MCF3104645.1 DUF397 domain-containing protein [Streptomyces roseoverticillatus]